MHINYVERLRDSSCIEALTLEDIKKIMENIGAVSIRTEHQDLQMDLETLLLSSHSKPSDRDKITQLFEKDLTDDKLPIVHYSNSR